MLKNEANFKLLRQIGSDINQWQLGEYPPGMKLFLFIWGLPTAVSVLLMTLQLTTVLVSAFFLMVAWRVTTAVPTTWEETLDNPGLVTLTTAERWDGKLPTTMIPGNSVPFINAK